MAHSNLEQISRAHLRLYRGGDDRFVHLPSDPSDLHDEEHTLLARIRAGEHIAHYETTRVRKDGQRILVSLTLSPLYDATGQLIGASAVKRDVTNQRTLRTSFSRPRGWRPWPAGWWDRARLQ